MTIQTNLRNADLSDLAALLQEQQVRKIDTIVPASQLRSEDGVLVVRGAEAQLSDEGVTQVDGRYLPTRICDEGVAEKLGVPLSYIRRLREQRPDLYDANVNGWLHGTVKPNTPTPDVMAGYSLGDLKDGATVAVAADPRSFLLRGFRGDEDGGVGIARALLSDKYARMDNLDVLMAALDGVKAAGVEVDIESCDLTERNMRVRVVCPQVTALAPVLLDGYRSPFRDPAVEAQRNHGWTLEQGRAAAAREGQGYEPGTEPVVWAGFIIGNSETGGGAFSLTPSASIRICKNGLTFTAEAIRAVHVGGKLDAGEVKWTDDTQRKAVALITAKTRDAVATFLSSDYLAKKIAEIEVKAGAPVTRAAETIEKLGKALTYDEATIGGILDHFTRGGQMTAGGVLNAITSYAQVVDDADKAAEIEASALKALDFASALQLS